MLILWDKRWPPVSKSPTIIWGGSAGGGKTNLMAHLMEGLRWLAGLQDSQPHRDN